MMKDSLARSTRLKKSLDKFHLQFGASISFDYRLALYDLKVSKVHTSMLHKAGLIDKAEATTIIKGLEEIKQDFKDDKFKLSIEQEDIHLNIEKSLINKVGEVGKKLHTGRSRNDLVATSMRLYCYDQAQNLKNIIIKYRIILLEKAKQEIDTLAPAFTHMQLAQPSFISHHLCTWDYMLGQDLNRINQYLKTIKEILPLGAAACCGTSHNIDSKFCAKELGFKEPNSNSMAIVSDRDFIIEIIFICSMIMQHLSRVSEEVILWVCPLFNFCEIGDQYCTSSSIMPQKKNPDTMELIRGKTGRVYGDLITLLTVMKAQPFAYNRDMQEDKEALFDAIETTFNCLKASSDVIDSIKFNHNVLKKAASMGFTTATDLADYLVSLGVSFRTAYNIVGEIIKYCLKNNKNLEEITLREAQQFCNLIGADFKNYTDAYNSAINKKSAGSTNLKSIKQYIKINLNLIK